MLLLLLLLSGLLTFWFVFGLGIFFAIFSSIECRGSLCLCLCLGSCGFSLGGFELRLGFPGGFLTTILAE